MKVPVGLGTIVGYGSALILAAVAVVEALSTNGPTPESVKWLLILSAAKAGLTTLGRQWQAGKAVEGAGEEPQI